MKEQINSEARSDQENRDRQSKILLRFMTFSKSIVAMHGKTIEDVFKAEDETGRRELIDQLSGDDYIDLLCGINGILRNKPKEKWVMDGVGVTAAGHEVIGKHIFPHHADKKEILEKAWAAAQRMNHSARPLEEIGMLLGSLLVETHPFNDGNGRTSRFIYRLIKEGFDQNNLATVLSEDGRDEVDMALTKLYIDRLFKDRNKALNTRNLDGILPDEELPYGKIVFPDGVDESARKTLVEAGRNDDLILSVTLFRFLQEHRQLKEENITKIFGTRNVLLVQNLLAKLTPLEVEDIAIAYWSEKKKYTEDIIDIFENPDKPEYLIMDGREEMSMLDHFKQRIESKTVLI